MFWLDKDLFIISIRAYLKKKSVWDSFSSSSYHSGDLLKPNLTTGGGAAEYIDRKYRSNNRDTGGYVSSLIHIN